MIADWFFQSFNMIFYFQAWWFNRDILIHDFRCVLIEISYASRLLKPHATQNFIRDVRHCYHQNFSHIRAQEIFLRLRTAIMDLLIEKQSYSHPTPVSNARNSWRERSMPSESDGCDHQGGQNGAAFTEPRHGI